MEFRTAASAACPDRSSSCEDASDASLLNSFDYYPETLCSKTSFMDFDWNLRLVLINIAVSYEGWIGRRGSGKIGFGWIAIMIGAERAGRRNGCWNGFVFRSLIGLGCWIGAASLVSTMKGLMGFGRQLLRQRRRHVRMAKTFHPNCRLA